VLTGDKVFLDVGTHAAIPNVPGLEAAKPLTHVDALELDYLPQHLIVIGGGYSGLELAQAYLRFGSEVTIIESGPQLMGREDVDVSQEMRRILSDEGMRVLLEAQLLEVRGDLGTRLHLSFALPPVTKTLMAATSWSRWDAFRIPPESDFRRSASNWTVAVTSR
jgi:pyruvate/2-oxoglutarate dehydrogenase complex dihydrolipoamide dehydrogenase (E3) component